MADYWFDSNFFIPSAEAPHYTTTLKKIIEYLNSKDNYTLKITKLITEELTGFSNLIKQNFEIFAINNTPEFRNFCRETSFALGYSKNLGEPADASLAYAAGELKVETFIVSNDEGFLRVKRAKPHLMPNIEIIEPTDFLKHIMLEIEDESFREAIRGLIIHYAEHFIVNRLNDRRSIGRILESLLVVDTITTVSREELVSAGIPSNIKLPKDDKIVLEKFISSESLSLVEEARIKPVIDCFEPFVEYQKSIEKDIHDNITRFLYILFPVLISNLRQLNRERSEGILGYIPALERFMRKKMFNIRIRETIAFFRDCYFDKALFHFRPLLESDWNIELSEEKKGVLKFLYGIFTLNIQDFEFFTFLIESNFWKEFPYIQQIFKILLKIGKGSYTDELNKLEGTQLKLFYNLGLYYCNTRNRFGLQIFDAIFQLNSEKLGSLEWHKEFLKRFLLELRINNTSINSKTKDKFLNFLEPRDLENNTRKKFDRSNLLKEFTPIDNTKFFFRQRYYLIQFEKLNGFHEAYCWNDNIKSIVILKIPSKSVEHLENVRFIEIKKGNIMTKNIPLGKKLKGRIMIILDNNCKLEYNRFKMEIAPI